MKNILWGVILVLVLTAPAFAQPYQLHHRVNNFILPDTSGSPVSLFDYANRIKFLVFWSTG